MRTVNIWEGRPDDERISLADLLKELGWSKVHHLGDSGDMRWGAHVYHRVTTDPDGEEYALEVFDSYGGSPLIVFDNYPEMLDALARWAPVIQADAIAYAVSSADDPDISDIGLFERIGAKLRFGNEQMPSMLREQAEIIARRRANAAAKKAAADGRSSTSS